MRIPESELILNNDGSIYHLNLLPEDIAETIILVGDPDRVPAVSKYFDSIELKKQKRELITHTGFIGHKRLTVLSTGMSTDNIDIVINELDALANIDFKTRTLKSKIKSLEMIRVGTAGGLQKEIPLDSIVVSKNAIGLDGLANFYQLEFNREEIELQKKFAHAFQAIPSIQNCYAIEGDPFLINLFGQQHIIGTTVTCPGFYAPQGRILRGQPKIKHFPEQLTQLGMSNFEMETSGIYTMGRVLGHKTCSLSAIVANRCTQLFSTDAYKTIDKLICFVLEKVARIPEIA
jgi:uridine phosphorylase